MVATLPDRPPAVHRVIGLLLKAVLVSTARVRLVGEENLPRSGPLIIVANHASNADPPLVGAWVALAMGRSVHWLAKEQLFVGPLGRFLHSQGVIMVRRGRSDVQAYRDARDVLARGRIVCIFPEGTRSLDGTLQEAKEGVALLAARAGVPILPVGISGSYDFLPPSRRFPRIGARITLRVGKPFRVRLDPVLQRRAAVNVASTEIMSRIAALVDPPIRGRYRAWADEPVDPSAGATGSAAALRP